MGEKRLQGFEGFNIAGKDIGIGGRARRVKTPTWLAVESWEVSLMREERLQLWMGVLTLRVGYRRYAKINSAMFPT